MPYEKEEDDSQHEYLRGAASMLRLSERNPKETIKRVQKKFTFYAEYEFRPPRAEMCAHAPCSLLRAARQEPALGGW